jgi:hypothetical protein
MPDVSKTKTVSYLVRFRKTTRGDVVLDDWKTRGRGWTARNYLPSDVCRVLKACLGMGKTGQGRYGVRASLDELLAGAGGLKVSEVRGRVVAEVTVTREISGVAFRKRLRKLQEPGTVRTAHASAEAEFRPEHAASGFSLVIIDEADAVPRGLYDAVERGFEWCNPKGGRR